MSSVAERDASGQILRSVSVFTELKELASIERHHRELYRLVPANFHSFCSECERHYHDNLIAALQAEQWRIAGNGGAADLLGLKPSTLRGLMKTLAVSRPD